MDGSGSALLFFGLVGCESNLLIRVLMVDSDKTVADGAAMLLRNRGYKARAAYSAEGAIAAAKDLHPHALIADAVMPGTDGIELAAWFAENMPDCKVVLISFNPSVSWRIEEAQRRGHVHAFILKREDLPQVLAFLSAIVPDAP
jgi:two-component system, OmpR family, response regulator